MDQRVIILAAIVTAILLIAESFYLHLNRSKEPFHAEPQSDFAVANYDEEDEAISSLLIQQSTDEKIARLRDVVSSINDIVTESICSKADNCTFEPKDVPPFTIYTDHLPQDAVEVAKKLRESTLLIIVFNMEGTYHSAPLFHAMYSPLFGDIRFCGPSLANSTTFRDEIALFWPREIAEALAPFYLDYRHARRNYLPHLGETMYYCVNLALDTLRQTRPRFAEQIDGVFLIHDDVIFNFWHLLLKGYDLSQSYVLPTFVVFDLDTLLACSDNGGNLYFGPEAGPAIPENGTCANQTNNYRPFTEVYAPLVKQLYKEMKEVAENSNQELSGLFASCLANLTRNAKGPNRAFVGLSDMFYLAKRDFDTVLPIFKIARDNHVYQEITMGFAFHACKEPGSFGVISSSGYAPFLLVNGTWQRKSVLSYYDAKRLLFGHPLKLSGFSSLVYFDKTEPNETLPELCLYCLLAQYANSLTNRLEHTWCR